MGDPSHHLSLGDPDSAQVISQFSCKPKTCHVRSTAAATTSWAPPLICQIDDVVNPNNYLLAMTFTVCEIEHGKMEIVVVFP